MDLGKLANDNAVPAALIALAGVLFTLWATVLRDRGDAAARFRDSLQKEVDSLRLANQAMDERVDGLLSELAKARAESLTWQQRATAAEAEVQRLRDELERLRRGRR